jgi:hypothetical protein
VERTKQDSSSPAANPAKALAERWGLRYLEASELSTDRTAFEIVTRDESRRLGVLQLEAGAEGPVFAVVEPSEEKFVAVRALAGENASFVVVSRQTLDAGMKGKAFGVAAPTQRPSGLSEAAARTHEALDNLVNHIESGAGTLRAQVTGLMESLESTQRELAEVKEQLAEEQRSSGGHDELVVSLHSQIAALTTALEESESLNESMSSRLQRVVDALTNAEATTDTWQ